MTVPTPSSQDPDRSRRDQSYDPWSRSGSQQRRDPGGSGQQGQLGQPGPSGHDGPYGPQGNGAHEYGADEDPGYWRTAPGFGGGGVWPETRRALLCGLAVTVCGIAFGLLWLWLAPRIPLFTDGKAVFLKDPEGEEAVAADGTFVLLALGFGLVTGLLVFLRSRRGSVGLVVGLAVGALLGSVVAWRLGVWLGPNSDVVALAKSAPKGKTFDGPLRLQAKGALLTWPVAALVVHLVLMTVFGKRDPEPVAPELLDDMAAPKSW